MKTIKNIREFTAKMNLLKVENIKNLQLRGFYKNNMSGLASERILPRLAETLVWKKTNEGVYGYEDLNISGISCDEYYFAYDPDSAFTPIILVMKVKGENHYVLTFDIVFDDYSYAESILEYLTIS